MNEGYILLTDSLQKSYWLYSLIIRYLDKCDSYYILDNYDEGYSSIEFLKTDELIGVDIEINDNNK